jgi:hypothetical protein
MTRSNCTSQGIPQKSRPCVARAYRTVIPSLQAVRQACQKRQVASTSCQRPSEVQIDNALAKILSQAQDPSDVCVGRGRKGTWCKERMERKGRGGRGRVRGCGGDCVCLWLSLSVFMPLKKPGGSVVSIRKRKEKRELQMSGALCIEKCARATLAADSSRPGHGAPMFCRISMCKHHTQRRHASCNHLSSQASHGLAFPSDHI